MKAVALTLVSVLGIANHCFAQAPMDFDQKHKQCLEQIAVDAEQAYEDSLAWMSEGGGRRAKHCSAMALFALGLEDEAAYRIETMAKDKDRISTQIRRGYYTEASDLWLEGGESHKAYSVASEGLKEFPGDVALHIARARAYGAMERWDYAEIDLNSALAFDPNNTQALRYRADARRRQGKLTQAKVDIDRAVGIDFKDVDTLLVRGQINEAIRKQKQGVPTK